MNKKLVLGEDNVALGIIKGAFGGLMRPWYNEAGNCAIVISIKNNNIKMRSLRWAGRHGFSCFWFKIQPTAKWTSLACSIHDHQRYKYLVSWARNEIRGWDLHRCDQHEQMLPTLL